MARPVGIHVRVVRVVRGYNTGKIQPTPICWVRLEVPLKVEAWQEKYGVRRLVAAFPLGRLVVPAAPRSAVRRGSSACVIWSP